MLDKYVMCIFHNSVVQFYTLVPTLREENTLAVFSTKRPATIIRSIFLQSPSEDNVDSLRGSKMNSIAASRTVAQMIKLQPLGQVGFHSRLEGHSGEQHLFAEAKIAQKKVSNTPHQKAKNYSAGLIRFCTTLECVSFEQN